MHVNQRQWHIQTAMAKINTQLRVNAAVSITNLVVNREYEDNYEVFVADQLQQKSVITSFGVGATLREAPANNDLMELRQAHARLEAQEIEPPQLRWHVAEEADSDVDAAADADSNPAGTDAGAATAASADDTAHSSTQQSARGTAGSTAGSTAAASPRISSMQQPGSDQRNDPGDDQRPGGNEQANDSDSDDEEMTPEQRNRQKVLQQVASAAVTLNRAHDEVGGLYLSLLTNMAQAALSLRLPGLAVVLCTAAAQLYTKGTALPLKVAGRLAKAEQQLGLPLAALAALARVRPQLCRLP